MTYKLFDCFSGAGGKAMGYHRAGFEVVGVDIAMQKNYPFEFHQADALEYLQEHGHEFDAIHASPPCQAYSVTYSLPNVGEYPELIEPIRELLISSGKPYVIENVPGAPLINPVELCGSMFGLNVIRHRRFETGRLSGFRPSRTLARTFTPHQAEVIRLMPMERRLSRLPGITIAWMKGLRRWVLIG